jgi:hypothetical protein
MALAGAFAVASWAAPEASAADLVFWSNPDADKISYANLDGSGAGGDLDTTGATVDEPQGIALDPAAGRVYWANAGDPDSEGISYANLDGSGGDDLEIGGATVDEPRGVTIDHFNEPARIWWANSGDDSIAFASLDGTGESGGLTDLMGVDFTVDQPSGLLFEPFQGFYWANQNPAPGDIFFARPRSEAGDLDTAGATVNNPHGVALDLDAEQILWANNASDTISSAKLDGSGGAGDLDTSGARVNSPRGVAIDPGSERIFWTNSGDRDGISFAELDGSGGDNLATGEATTTDPAFLALLRAPSPGRFGGVAMGGKEEIGARLVCGGIWAEDLPGSHLYRAARSETYQWTLNGADIPGATASSITATEPGAYRCRVTGHNHAGASQPQTSFALVIPGPAPSPPVLPSRPEPPSNQLSLGELDKNKRKGTAKLTVHVSGPGEVELARTAKVKGASERADAPGEVRLPVKPGGEAKKKLRERGKVKVTAKVTFIPDSGGEEFGEARSLRLIKR